MPHHEYPSDFGDLVVTFEIKFPTKLTDQQKIGLFFFSSLFVKLSLLLELRKLLP
jgi:DnaJ-class molecular chaperone